MRIGRRICRFFSVWLILPLLAGMLVLPVHGTTVPPDSLRELARRIAPHLTAREASFIERYAGPLDGLFSHLSDLMPAAIGSDDYLQYNLDSWRISASGYPGDVTVEFQVRYLTTAEDEQKLTAALEADMAVILRSWHTPRERLRAIQDAICARVTYDASLTWYSAVAGWMLGTTVCQGYALLADRMLEMADIPSRILVGTLDGNAHAWNLVQIDGIWRHLDITNNDASKEDRYYLVGDDVLRRQGFLFDAVLRTRLIRESEAAALLKPDSAILPVPFPMERLEAERETVRVHGNTEAIVGANRRYRAVLSVLLEPQPFMAVFCGESAPTRHMRERAHGMVERRRHRSGWAAGS